jgi:hypothetical protein
MTSDIRKSTAPYKPDLPKHSPYYQPQIIFASLHLLLLVVVVVVVAAAVVEVVGSSSGGSR